MNRLRRSMAMVTGVAALLALGFVIAVAAGSLPGGDDDPILDVAYRAAPDLTPVLAWILLFLAIIGALISAASIRGQRQERKGGKRGLVAVVIGLATFAFLLSLLRPAAESWLEEEPSVVDAAAAAAGDTAGGGPRVWLFVVLLAGVVAAVVTRIALSVHESRIGIPVNEEAPRERPDPFPAPRTNSLGTDPRSRILGAYQAFEIELDGAGYPRPDAETTSRHARAAARLFNLDPRLVDSLIDNHARARYGLVTPDTTDAAAAERSVALLLGQMKR